jgi:hypothetical protein
MQATIDVRRRIQQDLRDFSRGEIDFQALVDRVEGACSTESGAPDIALELVEIEENEATGALQRGFLRVLKERIRQAQMQSPPPPPEAPGEPLPSDDLTIPLEAGESADEIIADLFPGPEDERFVPRQPVPETEVRPARVRHIEEARRRREARHGPRVGLHEPLEWPMPGPARDVRRRVKTKRSWLLFGLAGLILLTLLLKGPVEERYPDIVASLSQWFSAAVPPTPPANDPEPAAPADAERTAPGAGAPAQSSVEPQPAGPPPMDTGPQPGSSPEVGAATSSLPEVATGAPDVETPAGESPAASDGATTAPPPEPSTTDTTASAGTGGPGYFLITRPEFRVREDAGIVAITLRRAAGSAGQASVSWWTVPADALPAEDYADFGPREEVFAAGETTRVVYVPLVSDTVAEDRESFYVRIGEPTGAKLGSLTVATVTIFDDDL